tara:strand:+ start:226 stop:522 length:297 start_codon:yes stop_codon:yes gene_type:complete
MEELQNLIKFLKTKGLKDQKIPLNVWVGIIEYFASKQKTKQCDIPVVMPRTFTKEVLKKVYIQGYRKRAINSELKYDEISEQYAIAEFENWFKNLYEA